MLAGLTLVLAMFGGVSASPASSPASPPPACCRGGGHSGGHASHGSRAYAPRMRSHRAPRTATPHTERAPRIGSHRAPRTTHAPRSTRSHAPGARDSRGRLERSAAAKKSFERQTGHPNGWPGHVVDHIVPLACGGADAPGNMQWQTIEQAKAKDRVERRGCRR